MVIKDVSENKKTQGTGKSFGSFGEIVQGCLTGDVHFLVTLPIDLWAFCGIQITAIDGPSRLTSPLPKSQRLAQNLMNFLNLNVGWDIRIELSSTIPTGKGLSSSTADLLSLIRAFQQVFDFTLTPEEISKFLVEIEPHDALHYNSSVVYNHREGRLLKDLGFIPSYKIVVVDEGGMVDTLEYNKVLSFSTEEQRAYDGLLEGLQMAFQAKDESAIAKCAVESLRMHMVRTSSPFAKKAYEFWTGIGAMGAIITHSGTCAGFLFPVTTPYSVLQEAEAKCKLAFENCNTSILSTLQHDAI